MCEYCRFFHAENLPCEVCGKPFTVSTKTDSDTTRLNISNKPRRLTQGDAKPLSATEVNKRLQVAGLHEDTQLADGLSTGATVNALYGGHSGDSEPVFLAYMAIVDRLAGERGELARFRHRLVSGIAA